MSMVGLCVDDDSDRVTTFPPKVSSILISHINIDYLKTEIIFTYT